MKETVLGNPKVLILGAKCFEQLLQMTLASNFRRKHENFKLVLEAEKKDIDDTSKICR
jgi:hypothetical protein